MATHTNLSTRQLFLAIVVVAAGGALGTVLRDVALKINATHWYSQLVGTSGWASRVPWILMLINLVGVYVATVVLKGPLVRHDPNSLTRLVLITGFLGGFTSYSSLFVALGSIWHVSVAGAILTAGAAVLSGALVAWVGVRSWSR